MISRFHYYLYYALNVMERKGKVHIELDEPDGTCSSSTSKLTSEQLKIVNHELKPGQTIKVLALAGTYRVASFYLSNTIFPQAPERPPLSTTLLVRTHIFLFFTVYSTSKSLQKHVFMLTPLLSALSPPLPQVCTTTCRQTYLCRL